MTAVARRRIFRLSWKSGESPGNEVLGNSLCLHIWRVMLWYSFETHTPNSSRWILCPAGKDVSTSGG